MGDRLKITSGASQLYTQFSLVFVVTGFFLHNSLLELEIIFEIQSMVGSIWLKTLHRGYKTFFMLNSAEHET